MQFPKPVQNTILVIIPKIVKRKNSPNLLFTSSILFSDSIVCFSFSIIKKTVNFFLQFFF